MPRITIEESRYVVLRKLSELGRPLNMLEIGSHATPEIIRNMAARGMVRVTVEITPRGSELMEKELIIRKRRKIKLAQATKVGAAALG